MPMPDPLRTHIYESGALIQQCAACDWAQQGHKSEIPECPACGAALDSPVAIIFGCTAVIHSWGSFDIYGNDSVQRLQRADLPEILQFMCRHAEDLRTGHIIRDFGIPRRIKHTKELKDQLWRAQPYDGGKA